MRLLKRFFEGLIESQARLGRARAAHHLAAMGYYKEARDIMLENDRT